VTAFIFPAGANARWRIAAIVTVATGLIAGFAWWRGAKVDPPLVATVRKGALTAQLTTGGTLRPIQSITYRSPLVGRESEIIDLAPEGTRVNEGDLVVRLDASELQRDVERARQEVRQSQIDLQVSEIEREESEAAVKSVAEGEGALGVEEARTRLQLAEKKAERLREEYQQLKPLLDKGFLTREELRKTAEALDQAEEDLALARKRTSVVVDLTHPRDRQHAALQLAQRESQLQNARTKVAEAQARLMLLVSQVENCSIYARRPGMVVYEEFLNTAPRRKIRVGDRVTSSHGIITIPEVSRMLLEASVGEAEVHRVRPGQEAIIRAEAFPGLRLTGRVTRVGTLARASADRPLEDKRFDLIVELDSTPTDLRPEMTARADIILGTRSDVLLLPVNAVFEHQGALVAHVVGPSGSEARTVSLGESNDMLVEVVAGLREGDQVLLAQPARGSSTPPAVPAATAKPATYSRSSTNALQPH
jgi:HlyD family secretion protein